jgi:hypothetical protein
MADLDKIMTALRNAHAAGDTAAAKRLAAMAKAAQGATPAARSNVGPDGMTPGERAKAAREGTLKPPSAARLAQQAKIDAAAEVAMRDPGLLPSIAAAGAQGATFGFSDEIVGAGGAALGAASDLLTGNWAGLADRAASRYANDRDFARMTLEDARNARPKTALAGEIAGALVSPASAALAPAKGATLAANVGRGAASGAAAGGIYGYGTGEGGVAQRAESAAMGGLGGAVIGGALPAVGAAMGAGLQKLVSPNGGADEVRLGLAKVLDDFGVPITAGQRLGLKASMYREGATAGGKRIAGEQAEAFTKAALKTAGIEASRATPEVLDEAAKRIGSVFDEAYAGVAITPDANSLNALAKTVVEFNDLAAKDAAPFIGNMFKRFTNAFRSDNTIPADVVGVWRSRLSKLTRSPDDATRDAAVQALQAVQELLDSSLIAAGKADDVARLETARAQWRNFLVIQKSAVREGDGLISPARLRANVIGQGEAAYARGKRGDIGALARAGAEVMEALPDSGTSQRWWSNIPGGAPAVLGTLGVTGASTAGFAPLATLGFGLASAALPSVGGAIRMSKPVQAYLANQSGNALSRAALSTAAQDAIAVGVRAALPQGSGPVGNALAERFIARDAYGRPLPAPEY